jgi:hypothetical protein
MTAQFGTTPQDAHGPVTGMQLRVARQTGRLGAVVAFYRDTLGLPEIDRRVLRRILADVSSQQRGRPG